MLLDDLKDRRGYSHLKEEALNRTIWRHRFGGGFGPVVRQNTEWMNARPRALMTNDIYCYQPTTDLLEITIFFEGSSVVTHYMLWCYDFLRVVRFFPVTIIQPSRPKPTKGCSADWRRRRLSFNTHVSFIYNQGIIVATGIIVTYKTPGYVLTVE